MGLTILVAGLALFLAPHVFTTFRDQRQAIIVRIGEGAYKIIYSLVSLAGLALIFYGYSQYRATGWIDVWYPPAWTRHLALQLNWLAIICVVAAYIPGKIKAVLRHPMLVGVKLWAFAHLISNGDLGSVILFGSILAWAVFDRITLKRRTDPGAPSIPQGGWPSDVVAIVVGTVIYVALVFLFHPIIIGVPVIFG